MFMLRLRSRSVGATVVILSVSALLGCAEMTGPSADLTGSWLYTATNMAGSNGLTCDLYGTTMTLSQNGSVFSGSYLGGNLRCTGDGGFVYAPQTIPSGSIVGGTLSGSQVDFNFDTPDFSNDGRVRGASMEGTATMTLMSGSERLVLRGHFGAVRH